VEGLNGTTYDLQARILNGGAIVGTDQRFSGFWPTSFALRTWGGPTNLWGATWTAADINSSTFGFSLQSNGGGTNGFSYVNYIQITITYTAPSGVQFAGATCTSIAGATVTHWSGTP
jgi:hypothetical protein